MFQGKSAHKNSSNPHQQSAFIQPKLKVGKVDDAYEQQADAAADQIISEGKSQENTFFTASPDVQAKHQSPNFFSKPVVPNITPGVQLKPLEQEENQVQKKEEEEVQKQEENEVQQKVEDNTAESESFNTSKDSIGNEVMQQQSSNTENSIQKKEEEEIQEKEEEDSESSLRKSADYDTEGSSGIENSLASSKGGGDPLPSDTQSEMESGFGADFSGVRVHNDSNAVQMNQDLGSQAFTNGSDIYFNEGNYDTESDSGKHLLAHELTHTVQQGASPSSDTVQQKEKPSPNASGAPTTVLDITNGLKLTDDWKVYTEELKSSKAFEVGVKIGSKYEGKLKLKKDKKPKEGEEQKFKLAAKYQYLDSKGLGFLNPLRGKGFTPVLMVNMSREDQTISGFLSIRSGDSTPSAKADQLLQTFNTKEGKEAMKLFGLGDIKSKLPENKFENGKLTFQTQDLSVSVDGFIQASGNIGIADEAFTFELNSTVNVGGLAEGEFNLKRGEDGNLSGKASITADIANVNANLSVEYEKGVVTIQGTGKISSEKFSGELTLLVTDEAKSKSMMHAALGVESMDKAKENAAPKASPTAAKPVAKKPGNQVLAGWGTVEATITPWLQGTAKIGVDAEGQITIVGEVTVPDDVELMPQMGKKQDLFEVEIRAGYGIPLVGQAFLFASIGMFANAGFGPLLLKNVGFTGTYSTDPKVLQNFSITGTLGINAFVILGLKAEAGVGITIIGHDVKAGVSVTAAAGLKAYAEATPTFEYKEANNPQGGKVGESRLKGSFEAAAQLFLQLAGSLFYELDSPWWSPAPDGREDFPLGEVQYPIGDSMGIGADIDWLVGGETPPELKFKPVEFDPDKFTADVMAEPPARKMGKSEQKPKGKFENKGGSGDKTTDPKATGKGKGLPENGKKKEDLKKLPDEQKYMRGLDELATLEKKKPKPTMSVVEAKMKKVKSKYGLQQVTVKKKKDGEVRVFVKHKKQDNGKHLLKIPLMSAAEAAKLRHTAMQDLRVREGKAADPKTSTLEESKAKDFIAAWLKAHPVVESAKVVDGEKTWDYFIDFGDKTGTEKGKTKGGETDGKGVPKNEGDGELGEVVKFSVVSENHTLWVDVSSGKPLLKLASVPDELVNKLSAWKKEVNIIKDPSKKNDPSYKYWKHGNRESVRERILANISKAGKLLGSINGYFKELDKKNIENEKRKAVDDKIEKKQRALKGVLVDLFKNFDRDKNNANKGENKDYKIIYASYINRVIPKAKTSVLKAVDEFRDMLKEGAMDSWNTIKLFIPDSEAAKVIFINPFNKSHVVGKQALAPLLEKKKVDALKGIEKLNKSDKVKGNRKTKVIAAAQSILKGQNEGVNKVAEEYILDKTKEDKLGKKLTSKLGSTTEYHDNFKSKDFTMEVKETSPGKYTASYKAGRATDDKKGNNTAESGKSEFDITVDYNKIDDQISDIEETRTVEGKKLVTKPEFYSDGVTGVGRAKFNSGNAFFDNAHFVGDRFGGSGYNNDLNIYPSSGFYNKREMASKEEKIAQKVKDKNVTNYDLKVTGVLRDDDDSTMGHQLRSILEKAFKKEQATDGISDPQDQQKISELREKMQKALTLDFQNVPAQFQSTTYHSATTNLSEIDIKAPAKVILDLAVAVGLDYEVMATHFATNKLDASIVNVQSYVSGNGNIGALDTFETKSADKKLTPNELRNKNISRLAAALKIRGNVETETSSQTLRINKDAGFEAAKQGYMGSQDFNHVEHGKLKAQKEVYIKNKKSSQ